MKTLILISLVSVMSLSAFPSEKGGNRNTNEIQLVLQSFERTNTCPVYDDHHAIDDICAEVEADVGLHSGKNLEKRFLRECCDLRD